MIDLNTLPEIPLNSKRIWHAKISGEIIRIKYKKKIKDKFSFYDVYKDDEEKNINSYFMRHIRKIIHLDKHDEEFKITNIEKIKYIGHSIPEIETQ